MLSVKRWREEGRLVGSGECFVAACNFGLDLGVGADIHT